MRKSALHIFVPIFMFVIALGILLPKQSAFAQGASAPEFVITRTPLAPLAGDAAKAGLSNYFKREQNWLDLQVKHFQEANQVATTTQQLIDAAKAEGKDTSSLESALAQFNSLIASAQNDHDQAASIISTANGFNGSGEVNDLSAAHQTVADARSSLRSAHAKIVQAVANLSQALRDWKNAN